MPAKATMRRLALQATAVELHKQAKLPAESDSGRSRSKVPEGRGSVADEGEEMMTAQRVRAAETGRLREEAAVLREGGVPIPEIAAQIRRTENWVRTELKRWAELRGQERLERSIAAWIKSPIAVREAFVKYVNQHDPGSLKGKKP
jgi:hypothetical protein